MIGLLASMGCPLSPFLRTATVDQVDGDVALLELAGPAWVLASRACLPDDLREGEHLLIASFGVSHCPLVLERGWVSALDLRSESSTSTGVESEHFVAQQ